MCSSVDHFEAFGREVLARTPFADLRTRLRQGTLRGENCDFVHLAGLSRNHQLLDEGRTSEIFEPEEFRAYLAECIALDCHPTWRSRALEYLGGRT